MLFSRKKIHSIKNSSLQFFAPTATLRFPFEANRREILCASSVPYGLIARRRGLVARNTFLSALLAAHWARASALYACREPLLRAGFLEMFSTMSSKCVACPAQPARSRPRAKLFIVFFFSFPSRNRIGDSNCAGKTTGKYR